MKFILTDKAKDYIKLKNIKNIFINPDLNSKSACCGISTLSFVINTDDKEIDKYKVIDMKDIDIYYNPTMDLYLTKDQEFIISAIGFGKYKKFYLENEINFIERE